MENLKLWNKHFDVDPNFTKTVATGGRRYTTVDAQYIKKLATEEWGSIGGKWGLKDLKWSDMFIGDDKIMIILDSTFFYPEGEMQYRNAEMLSYVSSKGKTIVDNEVYKKVITNTISKCLGDLGFAGAIYMGMFDDQEYMNEIMSSAIVTINPNDVQKLLKGLSYYQVDKKVLLDKYIITHLKDLPQAKLNEAEALIKELSKREEKRSEA